MAREACDRGFEQCIRLERLQLDDEIRSDAARLLDQARRIHRAARQAYLIILQRYSDFVTQGTVHNEWHVKQ